MGQPIIRGIQSVGAVDIWYKYNNNNGLLPIPSSISLGTDANVGTEINTGNGINLAGFRLDEEFLRANPQIASSIVIPILGGGGVSVTNNNRTGALTLRSTKVSSPSPQANSSKVIDNTDGTKTTVLGTETGSMLRGNGFGPVTTDAVFDAVFIAQVQQGQEGGGDSVGATIAINFNFSGVKTIVQFEGCTVNSVDPLALAGNNVPDYNIVWNYLNWRVQYNAGADAFITT